MTKVEVAPGHIESTHVDHLQTNQYEKNIQQLQ